MGWRGRGAGRESRHLMDDATQQNLRGKCRTILNFWRRVNSCSGLQ